MNVFSENNNEKTALVQLHLSILLAGFTGIFGRLITLHEVDIVVYRLVLSSLLVFVMLGFPRIGWRNVIRMMFCGVLLGFHWLLFYGSIKASNVSIGVVCYSLISFYTVFIEPCFFGTSFSWRNLLLSLFSVLGVCLIFSFDTRYRLGIGIGVVSSLVSALYTMTTKHFSSGVPVRAVLAYEIYGGLIGVALLAPVYLHVFPPEADVLQLPLGANLAYLVVFVLFCTLGLYWFQFLSFKKISTFTVNLSYNLEPIYSIVLAFLLLGEAHQLNVAFYCGLILIFSSVAVKTLKSLSGRDVEG